MNDILEQVAETRTQFVRIVWCDNANVIRAKAIHASALERHLAHGVGIAAAQQGLPATVDAPAAGSGLGPVGEVRLVPDWSTFTPLPYAPGHARTLGTMTVDGAPWAVCPRAFLGRMVRRAADAGLDVVAAFENEFYLLRDTPDGPRPTEDTVFAATRALDLNRTAIDDLAELLETQGLSVEQVYAESGPSQYEMSIRHAPALAAADRQVVFRETTHAAAARHGLRASFLPKPFADRAGSGCHLHLSLWRDGRNLMPEPNGAGTLSSVARAFVAGVLEHLPALAAVTTPTPNSYRRLQPRSWAGAFRCWGVDNREAAVRVPSSPDGAGATNVELKTCDATANPYLALGAVIAAGLDGVARGLEPGEPIAVDPADLAASLREARGIEPLPARLSDAVARLRADSTLLDAFGPDLARAFVAVREAERDVLEGVELEDEVRLLLERY